MNDISFPSRSNYVEVIIENDAGVSILGKNSSSRQVLYSLNELK